MCILVILFFVVPIKSIICRVVSVHSSLFRQFLFLDKLSIDEMARSETLTIKQIIDISNELAEM